MWCIFNAWWWRFVRSGGCEAVEKVVLVAGMERVVLLEFFFFLRPPQVGQSRRESSDAGT